jgi:hypothetical protein
MNKTTWIARIKTGLAAALLAVAAGGAGCAVGVGPGYDGGVVVGGPDVFLGGGFYDRGRDVHAFSHRGAVSRGVAHGGGGRRR